MLALRRGLCEALCLNFRHIIVKGDIVVRYAVDCGMCKAQWCLADVIEEAVD